MLLTCGAKGTRTPDPLLANNRQQVHRRPSPQVTVPGRPSASLWIRPCCGTSVLYFSWHSSAPVPVAILRCCIGSRSSPHLPARSIFALTQHYPQPTRSCLEQPAMARDAPTSTVPGRGCHSSSAVPCSGQLLRPGCLADCLKRPGHLRDGRPHAPGTGQRRQRHTPAIPPPARRSAPACAT